MEIHIETQSGLARIVLVGRLERDDVETAARALAGHPDFHPGLATLWDLRQAQLGHTSAAGVRALLSPSEVWPGAPNRRVALLVSGDLDFGLTRMWTALAERAIPANRRVFRSESEAMEWLRA